MAKTSNTPKAYQVIARRWRPKQFDQLVGQDHIVRILKNAIETNRIAHAYLFVGPRGTGKTSTARLFAMALNCTGGPRIDPQESDPLVQSIIKGACMDVIEIDGASNNSVDQIRELRESCQYAPAECKYKIYIIDEVHMLSTAAFNALLKTLEEPPPHIKFIFATTEAHKVLPTITSRCQRLEFRPIAENVLAAKLKEIAQAEGIQIEDTVYTLIARLAQGGMRDAQSILDQLIAFCGKKITEADVLDIYGIVPQKDIDAFLEAMVLGQQKRIMELSEKLLQEGRDVYRTLLDIESAIHRVMKEVAVEGIGEVILFGRSLRTEQLMRMLDALQSGEERIKTGLSEQVNFEVTLLKAMEQSHTRAIDSLIRELTELATSEGASNDLLKKKAHGVAPVMN